MGNNYNVFFLQLNLLAAFVLLSIALALFLRRNNIRANILLGVLLLYPAISIILNIIFIIFKKHQFLFLAPLNIGFNLTFGPVLLAYLHLIQGKEGKTPAYKIINFIPALLVGVSSIYYIIIPEENQRALLAKVLSGQNLFINLVNLLLLVHVGIYLYAAWGKVKKHSEVANELEMPHIYNSINWQKSLTGYIIFINIFLLLAYALPIALSGSAHIYSDLIATPASALLIYVFVIYKGLSYQVIYNQTDYNAFMLAAKPLNSYVEELYSQENNNPPGYKDKFIDDKKKQLLYLFDEQKIFTKPGLKLHDVADMLKISPASLSVIINKHLNMTFFEMLNKYRVEEAKQLFIRPDHQHYKIESIGKISGFNSRASFFSVFKKQVGKTPQLFREEYFGGKIQD